MYASKHTVNVKTKSAKCETFKSTNIGQSSAFVALVWMHNSAKYEGAKISHVDRRGT